MSVLFFFIIVASLFPLGIGPEPQLLKKLAPGVLWVGALLATMLSLPRLFADDYRDGTLEQLVLAPQPLGLTVIGKVIAHWLVSDCHWHCWRRYSGSSSIWRWMHCSS